MRGLSLSLALLAAAALAAGCDRGECEPAWAPVFEDLDRSVLAVTGRADDDVILVGGGLGDGLGALLLRYDGRAWRDVPTGRDESLWWAWADPDGPEVWLVGEAGLVLRHDGAGFEVIESGTDATLFGVWGASADDLWIVGGEPGPAAGADQKDVVLRWDGQSLTRDSEVPARGAALFKVWGASAGDVWVVGESGTILHRTAAGWQDRSAEATASTALLTVHGCSATEVYAVGRRELISYDGQAWSAVAGVDPLIDLNGVSCAEDGVLVVGNAGTKLRLDRATGAWIDEQLHEPWDTDFHAGWVSPGGDAWAVGGNFLLPPGFDDRIGVVGFRGCDRPPSSL